MSTMTTSNTMLLGLKKLMQPIAITLLFSVLCWGGSKLIQPTYQATTSFIILRPALELPDFKPESMTNRWIWARDGMAIQDGMITDALLGKLIQSVPSAGTDLVAIRKSISINFAGAESQHYTYRVDHNDPKTAVLIANFLLQNTRDYLHSNGQGAIEAALQAIDQQLSSTKPNPDKNSLLRMRSQLENQLLLQRTEDSRQLRIITEPSAGQGPVWPKPRLFAALGLVVGVFAAIALELLRRSVTSHK